MMHLVHTFIWEDVSRVLSVLEGTTDESVAKMYLCMLQPLILNIFHVTKYLHEEVDHEREVLKQQALNEGKPENIVVKMVEGRLSKYFEEICLLDQSFVKDPDQKVK